MYSQVIVCVMPPPRDTKESYKSFTRRCEVLSTLFFEGLHSLKDNNQIKDGTSPRWRRDSVGSKRLHYFFRSWGLEGSACCTLFFLRFRGRGAAPVLQLFRTFFLLSVTLLAKASPPSRFLPRLAAGSAAVLGEPVLLGLLSLASTTTTLKNNPNGLCPAPPTESSAWVVW